MGERTANSTGKYGISLLGISKRNRAGKRKFACIFLKKKQEYGILTSIASWVGTAIAVLPDFCLWQGAFLEDGGNLCTGADGPVSGMVPVYPLFAEARKMTFSQVSEFQSIREEPFLAGK